MTVEFGKRMQEVRLKAGMKLEQLAELVGRPVVTLTLIEAGIKDPPNDLQLLLEDKLPGLTIDPEAAIEAHIQVIETSIEQAPGDPDYQLLLRTWTNVVRQLWAGSPLDERNQAALEHYLRFSGEDYQGQFAADVMAAMSGALERIPGAGGSGAMSEPAEEPSPPATDAAAPDEADFAGLVTLRFAEIVELVGGLDIDPAVAAEAQGKVEELKQGLLALASGAELPDEELHWFQRLLGEIKEISAPAFDKVQAILRHPVVAREILEAILRSVE